MFAHLFYKRHSRISLCRLSRRVAAVTNCRWLRVRNWPWRQRRCDCFSARIHVSVKSVAATPQSTHAQREREKEKERWIKTSTVKSKTEWRTQCDTIKLWRVLAETEPDSQFSHMLSCHFGRASLLSASLFTITECVPLCVSVSVCVCVCCRPSSHCLARNSEAALLPTTDSVLHLNRTARLKTHLSA